MWGGWGITKSHLNGVGCRAELAYSDPAFLRLYFAKVPQRAHKTPRVPNLCPAVPDPSSSLRSPLFQIPILNVPRSAHHKNNSLPQLGAAHGASCTRGSTPCLAPGEPDILCRLVQRLVR